MILSEQIAKILFSKVIDIGAGRYTMKMHIEDIATEIESCFLNSFCLTIDECKALNFFLQVHGILLKDNEEEYLHILRLINGLPQFIHQYEKENSKNET